MNQYKHEPWTKEGATAVRLAGGFDGGLGSALTRAWPLEREGPFDELLLAIDQAEWRRGGDDRHFG